jgi:mannonate dehydratase
MRIALGLPGDATDDHLRYARQLGCEGVVLPTPRRLDRPGATTWAHEDLAEIKAWVEGHGLRLEALQRTPNAWIDPIRLNLPDAERALEDLATTVRNVGRAGIPALAYNWRPNQLYRTGTKPGRGGAEVTHFDPAHPKAAELPLSHGRAYTADDLWASYERFARAIVPVAEEAGVRLALHPDDPPGPSVGGVARIFSSFEGFERASRIVDSPAWGLLFCTGCWAEMGGTEYVLRGIRHFGARGQIVYVHFRDVIAEGGCFEECFIGEGPMDVVEVMRALKEVGFDGAIIDDHAPKMVGDEEGWHPRARAYQTGYLAGLLRALA